MNGWQFMGEHPFLTFFLAYFACSAFEGIGKAILFAMLIRRRR